MKDLKEMTKSGISNLTNNELLARKKQEYKNFPIGVITENLNEITPKPVTWLWETVIPLGKITLMVGDPGLGKSLASLDFAARRSSGQPWPDGTPCKSGYTLILSAEDDPADTIRPRIDALNADVKKIDIIKAIRFIDDKGAHVRLFSLDQDVEKLEVLLKHRQEENKAVDLLIIDPISAYLGDTYSNVNAKLRSLLMPLSDLAARYNVAVLGITHLNKSTAAAIYRATGSMAFVAAARAVWAVYKDLENESRILLMPIKQNLSRNNGGFAYTIETCQNSGLPLLLWEKDRVHEDVNNILQNHDPENQAQWKEAVEWLRDYLAEGEPLPVKQIMQEAIDNGISKFNIKKASRKLEVIKEKDGFQGRWKWKLNLKGSEKGKKLQSQEGDSLGVLLPFVEKQPQKKMDNIPF